MKSEVLLWLCILGVLAWAVMVPGHRRYSVPLFALALAGVIGVILLSKRDDDAAPQGLTAALPAGSAPSKRIDFERFHIERSDMEDPEAKTRIPVTLIHFDQMRLEGQADPGAIKAIHARLHNDSPRYALTDFGYDLAVQDCDNDAGCTVIYRQRGWAAAWVPARQARDVSIAVGVDQAVVVPPAPAADRSHIVVVATDTRAYEQPVR